MVNTPVLRFEDEDGTPLRVTRRGGEGVAVHFIQDGNAFDASQEFMGCCDDAGELTRVPKEKEEKVAKAVTRQRKAKVKGDADIEAEHTMARARELM
jgi:hypothetical protein